MIEDRRSILSAQRALEFSGMGAMLALSTALAVRVAASARSPAAWALTVAAAVLGYVLADFVSGCVHWMADRLGTAATPLLGRTFIQPFREHHADPKAITRHGFIETNGNNCLVSLPLLAVAYLAAPASPGHLWGWFGANLVLFLCAAVFATNQFHKWAHMDRPPALARALQRWRLILPPAHHELHHAAPYETHYCITTGWLNAPIERLRLFERLERLFGRCEPETHAGEVI